MKGVVADAGVDGNPLLPPLDIPSSTFGNHSHVTSARRWVTSLEVASNCKGEVKIPKFVQTSYVDGTLSRWIPAASCSGRTCCCCLSAQCTEAEDGVGEMGVGIGVAGFEPLSSCFETSLSITF